MKKPAMELTHHLIAYIVENLHKKLMKTNLMKLIYLVDLEYFKKRGKQATNFNYFYYKKGPWTAQFDQALSELEGFEVKCLRKEKIDKKEEYFIFCKGPKPRFQPRLPSDLKEITDKITFVFNECPQEDLLKYVYSTLPMRGIKFGEEIDFSKIFPQPSVDPAIEKTVLEANKEYESTNFPKIIDSWIRESYEDVCARREITPRFFGSPGDHPTSFFDLEPPSAWAFRNLKRPSASPLHSLVEKGISLSEEILRDREDG